MADNARTGIDERTQRLIRTITGLDPELVDDYDIRGIDPRDRAQVRVDRNLAPKERVQSYVWMMDAGDEFPAGVMTRDGVIVDMNTRIMAYKERGDFFVRAWVIPVDYKDADADTKARISYVGECLNAKNGQPPSKEEQANQVRHGIRIGLGDKQISVEAGVNPTFVKSLRSRVAGETRLDDLGVEYTREDGEKVKPLIAEAALATLGKADDLDDDVFVAVAELARDAGFTKPEVQAAVSSAREQESPAARLDVVRREREANKERIASREQGRNGHPPLSRQLKRNLGFINKNTASALVERNRDLAEDHLEAIEQAIGILTEVADLQRRANAEMLAGGAELPVDAA